MVGHSFAALLEKRAQRTRGLVQIDIPTIFQRFEWTVPNHEFLEDKMQKLLRRRPHMAPFETHHLARCMTLIVKASTRQVQATRCAWNRRGLDEAHPELQERERAARRWRTSNGIEGGHAGLPWQRARPHGARSSGRRAWRASAWNRPSTRLCQRTPSEHHVHGSQEDRDELSIHDLETLLLKNTEEDAEKG